MAAAFPQRTRPGLTRDLWLNIARYLDADSLFSFEESKLVNIDFLESWEATEAVVLSPHSNDEYLAAFLDCIDVNNVRSVCVANCLMASPDHLLDRISSLSNLVKLDCVNCRISPRHLVRTISTSLPKLKKLCFSIDYCPIDTTRLA
ncbi:hypothetical protein HPB52_020575 [Rhipicephalus sanguineus]|uniref:Uncharacterized protein n=1 Tax=Rhipicephalus sanguineus TaxID=34632 RepID=A0A9D4TBH5_RHISA|nr:hypothetical protein HPB52_020575 [Rhipicephalus sanguineus]